MNNPFYEIEQRFDRIENLLKEVIALNGKSKTKLPEEYLTRQEVADLFKVQLSTIHSWAKTGKLKSVGIGSRVYFKRSDVETSLIPLNDLDTRSINKKEGL